MVSPAAKAEGAGMNLKVVGHLKELNVESYFRECVSHLNDRDDNRDTPYDCDVVLRSGIYRDFYEDAKDLQVIALLNIQADRAEVSGINFLRHQILKTGLTAAINDALKETTDKKTRASFSAELDRVPMFNASSLALSRLFLINSQFIPFGCAGLVSINLIKSDDSLKFLDKTIKAKYPEAIVGWHGKDGLWIYTWPRMKQEGLPIKFSVKDLGDLFTKDPV